MDLKCLQTNIIKTKALHGSSLVIYELLIYKYEHSDTLQLHELVALWADIVVSNRRRGAQSYWDVDRRRWVYHDKSQVEDIKKNWDKSHIARQAIQWFKYHVGNLVINGYAVVIPIINFDVSEKRLNN